MTTYGIDRSVVAGGTGSSTTALLADGSTPLTANWDAGNFDITALSFIASGASPTFELIRAVDTQTNTIEFQEADGSVRWKIEHAGSGNDNDFSVKRYNASGVLQDTPLLLDGVTGLVTVPALTVTGDLQYGTVAANTFPRRNTGNTGWEMKTPQQVADEVVPLRIGTESQAYSASGNTFSGIPSWATEIAVMWTDLSTNTAGSVALLLQIGDSGGLENTGYSGSISAFGASSAASSLYAGSSFELTTNSGGTTTHFGVAVLRKITSNTWVLNTQSARGDAAASYHGAGTKALSDTLTQLKIYPAADSFDAGTIAIHYR